MNRRRFIKYLGGTGMSLTFASPHLLAAENAAPDRFWISVNAAGGWDPTSFIDPKGNAPRADGRGPVNQFSADAIQSVGNINFLGSYPPDAEVPDGDSPGHLANFFSKHANRLLVINGLDTQTNNHSAGNRYVWSGKIQTGFPSFTALTAANTAPSNPLSFISNGGYDFTSDIVAPTRIGNGDIAQLLADPNAGRYNVDPENRRPYFSNNVYTEVEMARRARIQRLYNRESLPLRQRQIAEISNSRGSGENQLERFVSLLPDNGSRGLPKQAEVAVAAFASGVAVSANLNIGGFDTHGDHDFRQYRQITQLLAGIDHLWEEIERNNLQDKVTVLVGSDFGRTPFYNNDQGKDHWHVTSMLAMGAGIIGDRVIGATDENVEALPLDPITLQPDPDGIILTPKHIHQALRHLAGISPTLTGQFDIDESFIDLFG